MKTFLIGAGVILLAAAIWGALQVGGGNDKANAADGDSTPTATATTDSGKAPTPTPVPAQPTQAAPTAAPTQPQQPYGLNPQPQIGHPSMYIETGVPCKNQAGNAPGFTCTQNDDHTRRWNFDLLPGSVAIIGGFRVDGTQDGVYKVVLSGHVDTTVTDGFISVIEQVWGNNEFCFRLDQTILFRWAHAHVTYPNGWNPCPFFEKWKGGGYDPNNQSGAQPSATAAPGGQDLGLNGKPRRQTGQGATLSFSAGESVIGATVIIGGVNKGACYIESAPADGTVNTGAINYNQADLDFSKQYNTPHCN